MKTSFCTIAFRNSDLDIFGAIELISRLGYDSIEIWGNHLSGGINGVLEVRRALTRWDLPVAMLSPYFDLTASDEEWMASLGNAKRYIEYAGALGAPKIRVFTGFKGSDDVDRSTWRNAVEGLKIMASLAQQRGIAMALETHPGTLADTVESTRALLEEVSSPAFGVNLDIYHFWERGSDPVEALEALRPWVIHVHAKNTSLSLDEREANPHLLLHDRQAAQEFFGISSIADGNVDYQRFLGALLSGGYDDHVSIEWFGEEPEAAAGSELTQLHRLTKNMSALQAETPEAVAVEEESPAPLAEMDESTAKAAKAIEEAFAKAAPGAGRSRSAAASSKDQLRLGLGESEPK